MSKPAIAFITGGWSGEAEVSYKSAITIQSHIDKEKYEFYTIDVRRDGIWYDYAGPEAQKVDLNDFSIHSAGRKILFDIAFLGIHGTPGEDGKLQGYFDLIGLPYTSCSAATSAITFNKRFTVAVAAMSGIKVAKSFHFYRTDKIDFSQLERELVFPLFVKPSNGGSSIGMSKVPSADLLPEAVNKAFAEDDQVLIEEFIEGREFTIGVAKIGDEIITLPMTEVITHNYFFDFEAKYNGKSDEITPAVAPAEVVEKVKQAARKLYNIFDCRGVIRIDFIYNEAAGEPFMLEVNTVPGQSAASLIPEQVKCYGMDLGAFYSGLIETALSQKNKQAC